jgi:translation initiation factor IF-3
MIRVPEVRVIDDEGEQLGVLPIDEAIAIADEKGLDLVEVSPTAKPPVCKIVDFGKFKYEQSKREKESKKKQHVIHVKEVKFRPKTEEHDYQFKKRHAEEFLEKGDKVKFTVIFRGRELDHREMGFRILSRVKEELAHVATVERDAMFEGRLMTMFMAPLNPGKKPQKAGDKKEKPAAKKEVKAVPAKAEEAVEKTEPAKTEEPAAKTEPAKTEEPAAPAAEGAQPDESAKKEESDA